MIPAGAWFILVCERGLYRRSQPIPTTPRDQGSFLELLALLQRIPIAQPDRAAAKWVRFLDDGNLVSAREAAGWALLHLCMSLFCCKSLVCEAGQPPDGTFRFLNDTRETGFKRLSTPEIACRSPPLGTDFSVEECAAPERNCESATNSLIPRHLTGHKTSGTERTCSRLKSFSAAILQQHCDLPASADSSDAHPGPHVWCSVPASCR
ncbi:hypothetical protein QBC44DRAFT_69881 [Cladorrhinum sp. PSN332]|nr:hypothetical protein QBC44DRAFT_69881 [Cladorrhinum sp. PSN332]